MARKRKKEKRVASVDAVGVLERDLKNTALWIGISVIVVAVAATITRVIV
ncbi:hypothetical protein IC620_13510 [Hazenella sp. IB182357]|uniref:Uncharacterized protein n=1 Tax=Polycladospora coralii TaxID=2771432 RepID=A0A926RYB9_9BACL|nr:hypothetical protein [Polycladospora coralii]MBD1373366.1 hypothetical protein [Polycladospora coralii]MBS7531635.1 hypothetical protein [Polycladospora coralii]